MLITDNDQTATKTAEEATRELLNYGVNPTTIKVSNIFDFKKILLLAKKLKNERGDPIWLNITAGPGITIAALVLSFQNSNLIYYNEGPPVRVIVVNVPKVIQAFKGLDKAVYLIDFIKGKGEVEFKGILDAFPDESMATLSRKLSQLKETGILSSIGAGRGRQRKKFYINQENVI
ncbi:MAG: hypothetical protein QXW39_09445 [Candidatus Bathyarchaeia archaeon]